MTERERERERETERKREKKKERDAAEKKRNYKKIVFTNKKHKKDKMLPLFEQKIRAPKLWW